MFSALLRGILLTKLLTVAYIHRTTIRLRQRPYERLLFQWYITPRGHGLQGRHHAFLMLQLVFRSYQGRCPCLLGVERYVFPNAIVC